MKSKKIIAALTAGILSLSIMTGNTSPVQAATLKKPVLLETEVSSPSDNTKVKVTWKAVKGCHYQILKKSVGGTYATVGTVTATSSVGSYTDKNVESGTVYYYTVRQYLSVNGTKTLGNYDAKGIEAITEQPQVTADYTNLKTVLSWNEIEDADYYYVYRKASDQGSYKLLGKVAASDKEEYSYTDHYYKTLTSGAGSSLLGSNAYVDPSHNSLRYAVKAVKITETASGNEKTSISNYSKDGYCHMESPTIVSVTTSGSQTSRTENIRFGTVPNAEEYIIYSGHENTAGTIEWTREKVVSSADKETQTVKITVTNGDDYVAVKAAGVQDGNYIYSDMDRGFKISGRQYGTKNILYLGDSITYGTPYWGEEEKHIYSYAQRVSQLTGVRYYNPSVSGATLSYSSSRYTSRQIYSIYQHLALRISENKVPTMPSYPGNEKVKSSLEDYDVVVLEAGTNDYAWNVALGIGASTNTSTFCGALNSTLSLISQASKARVAEGKSPIKVVILDLFYSERVGSEHWKQLNRFTYVNSRGLTLTDYQKAINQIVSNYQEAGDLQISQFHTIDYVNADNCGTATVDNLHMTKYTSSQVGNALAEYLEKNIFQ